MFELKWREGKKSASREELAALREAVEAHRHELLEEWQQKVQVDEN